MGKFEIVRNSEITGVVSLLLYTFFMHCSFLSFKKQLQRTNSHFVNLKRHMQPDDTMFLILKLQLSRAISVVLNLKRQMSRDVCHFLKLKLP